MDRVTDHQHHDGGADVVDQVKPYDAIGTVRCILGTDFFFFLCKQSEKPGGGSDTHVLESCAVCMRSCM